MKDIYQFGSERSGSTLTKWFLEAHFDGRVHAGQGGWKHGPYCAGLAPEPDAPVLLSVRHPLSYLHSRWRFLSDRGEIEERPFHSYVGPGVGARKTHVLRGWSEFYGYWLARLLDWRARGRPAAAIRLEDWLRDPAAQLARLGDSLALGPPGELRLPEEYVAPSGEEERPREGFEDVRDRELGGGWRRHYADGEAERGWRFVDLEVAAAYGYAIDGPTPDPPVYDEGRAARIFGREG